MNRTYRIIFNASRGVWQAVSELAKSRGKSRSQVDAPKITRLQLLSYYLSKLSLARASKITASLLFMPFAATAEIIADPNAPNNQRPSIVETANGTPLINIQTPSGAGVSRNTYSQFDVDQQGVVFNNSRTNTQTQLGGWVEGNPWLAGGTARIILNEVNSNNPSYLRGYMEIAGSRAELVIANPSGITCDGCGFINASRGTLTTGVPIFTNGNLDGYRVEGGKININGAGLDASHADFTDLIARAVEINAGIWAKDLNITTGKNEVKADRSRVTVLDKDDKETDEAKPAFAIDTANLGGMYAGKIALIATEAGVGVRNAGTLGAGAGEVMITADGRIENSGQINSKTHTQLTSKNDIANSGEIISQSNGDIALTADGRVDNSGKVLSGRNTNVKGKAGINNTGTFYAGGNSELSSDGSIDNARIIAARGNARLSANTITSQRDSLLAAGMADDGSLLSQGDLVMDAIQSVRAQGQTLSGGDQSHQAASLDFSDGQLVARNLSFMTTAGDLDARRATILVNNDFSANVAQTFHSESSNVLADNINVNLTQDYTHGGIFQANSKANITTLGKFTNLSRMIAGDTLQVQAADIDNKASGELISQTTHLTADNSLTNRGLIDGSDTFIKTAMLTNLGTGRIYGDHVKVDAATLMNREENDSAAVIAARNRLDIGSQTLTNREHALLFSGGNMFIGGSLDENGYAQGKADTINNNSATIEATDGLTLTARQLFNTNEHLTTHEVEVGREHFDQYRPSGSSRRYNRDEVSFWFGEVWFLHINATGQNTDLYYRYLYDRITTETQIATTDPAKLMAGGNMHITADNVLNDNSHITAGGNLVGDIGELTNTEVSGNRTIADVGTAYTYYRIEHSGTDEQGISTTKYKPAPAVESIKVSSAVFQGDTAPAGSGISVDPIQEVKAIISADPNAPNKDVMIRSGGVNTTLPDNSLFHINPNPTAGGYLIETDPKFANYRTWLSSDFMLSRLAADPATAQKRLGDGFYEQRLVNEQISQLTGRQFLEGYSDSEKQYQALMENGVAFADSYKLTPGIALTAEQMSHLTQDIVWLVEKTVILPDGSSTKALVPQVYARVKPGDITGDGAVMSGRNVALNLNTDLTNRGNINAEQQVAIAATNINNLGGRINASDVRLHAQQDINNQGIVDAQQNLNLTAGHNINFTSTTSTQKNAQGDRTNISKIATAAVTDAGGQLRMTAGNDINLQAAHVVNNGADGQTTLAAGNDVNLSTVKTSDNTRIAWDGENYVKEGHKQDVGSQIQTQGDIQLLASNNLNAKAATVSSDKGKLLAAAGNDINLTAGEYNETLDERHQHEGSNGMASSTVTTIHNTLDNTQALATAFSGDSSSLQAGHDIKLVGSNSVATHDNELLAGNDISLQTARENTYQTNFRQEKTSGFFSGGGLGVSYGTQKQSDQTTDKLVTGAGSTVGSTEGNVNMQAGHNYQQIGSFVSTPKGDINIGAQNIDIQHDIATRHSTQQSKFEQTGFTFSITNPMVSAIQTASQMQSSAKKTDDTRMQILAGATTALAGKNAYDAVKADPKSGGGINIGVSLGTSKSESNSSQDSATVNASSLNAGGDIHLTATGAGKDSNITVKGSDITAGRNINLAADNEIQLLAGKNTSSQQGTSSSSGASIGVGYTFDAKGSGFNVNAGVSKGSGNSNGNSTTWRNTTLTAGNQLNLQSGGDTTLKGAVAKADNIKANIGGDLKLESLQDSDTYHSSSSSSSASIGYTFGTGMGSVSANHSNTKMNSDYLSVGEQTGLLAGSQGFQINVNGNTDLKGAKISSNQTAIDNHKNQLTTGTLTTSDIQNHAKYDASSSSIGGGYSFKGDKVGQNQQGQATSGSNAVPGNNLPSLNGFSATAPVAMNASGDASSTTKAGISHADITITDEAKQRELTGKDVATTISELNRDVSSDKDTSNSLNPIFDPDKIQANFDIVSAFSRETGTFLNNRAQETTNAKKALDEELAKPKDQQDASKIAQLNQVIQNNATWEMGGTGRRLLTAITAAASGNVTGSGAQFIQSATVNYLQSLGAEKIKGIADNLQSETARTALQGLLACGGAAAQGASCGSAASGAAASVVLNDLFNQLNGGNKNLTAEERQAQANIITSLITGITAAAGGDAAIATAAAQIEAENNSIKPIPIIGPPPDPALEMEESMEEIQKTTGEENPEIEEDIKIKEETEKFEQLEEASLTGSAADAAEGGAAKGGGAVSLNTQEILMPGGDPVGSVYPGATSNIRTVSSAEFQQIQSGLMSGATSVDTPQTYAGTWYQRQDGTVFGIRNSTTSGVTIDIIKSVNSSIPNGFKVHQNG
jgi:filamentous hemagglutinin